MRGSVCVSWPLCEGVVLSHPIVQAPLGLCDGPALAVAVSRAGGLGCLSLLTSDPAAAARRVAVVRARTPRPFLLAFTQQWEPESVVDACVAGGARLFQVFWWNGARLAPRIHAAGGVVFWQAGTREQVQEAAERGADVLVIQGREAGGQIRGGAPLRDLLPQVVAETTLPVVAGGGLGDARDVAETLRLGARAAMLGTRFVASEESAAPAAYKTRLVRAHPEELYLDMRLVGDWPCAPRRRIRTAGGDDDPPYFAGMGVGRISRVLPAAEIVRNLARF